MLFRTHFGPDLHRKNCEAQVSHAHQVVSGAREGEDPIHLTYATMSEFSQQRDRFQPAEAFFDALPFPLTDGIAWVPRGSPINGTPTWPLLILGDMRRNIQVSALGDKTGSIKSFVPANRNRLAAGNLLQHHQRRIPLCRSVGLKNFRGDNQSVAVLHQQISAIAQFGFFAWTFARQLGIGIGRRLMRRIRSLLARESSPSDSQGHLAESHSDHLSS